MTVGFPGSSVVKNLPAKQEMWVQSLGWEDPPEKKMTTDFNIFAGKSCGQRKTGNSPQDHKELDTLSN